MCGTHAHDGLRTPGRACVPYERLHKYIYVIQYTYIKHRLCNIKLRYLLCAKYHIILHILLVVSRCDDWAAAAPLPAVRACEFPHVNTCMCVCLRLRQQLARVCECVYWINWFRNEFRNVCECVFNEFAPAIKLCSIYRTHTMVCIYITYAL